MAKFFLSLIFPKTWKQTKIWLYQVDTLLFSNKVRNFGEPDLSATKMVTEYMMLWSNWPPSPRIGLKKGETLKFTLVNSRFEYSFEVELAVKSEAISSNFSALEKGKWRNLLSKYQSSNCQYSQLLISWKVGKLNLKPRTMEKKE